MAAVALSAVFCAGGAAAQAVAPAQPAPAAEPTALTWHAFASLSGTYNLNRPPSGLNGERVFDFNDRQFDVDVAEFVLAKPVVRRGQFGFRADFEAGQTVPRVSAAAGLFRDPSTGQARDVDLQQAYVSYMAGARVRVDAGKFVTPLGLEVIEGWDGYNDNATRSFLFGYAIPFTHTGVRVSVAGTHVSGLAMVANGWDDVKDNNGGKTVAGQITLAPVEALSIAVATITGPEQTHNNINFRTVYDLAATWKIGSTMTVGLSADDGRESHAGPAGVLARWRGAAAYTRMGVTKRVAVSLRAEVFADPEGARTGVAQRLDEFTATPELRLSPHVVMRGDLRVDRSNRSVFDARDGAKRTQPTAEFNLLLVFP